MMSLEDDDTEDPADEAIAVLERTVARARETPASPVADPAPKENPPPSPTAAALQKDPLEELARLAEQLRPEPRARWRPGPLPVALLGLLLVAAGAFAATRLSGRRPATAKPLLPRFEEEPGESAVFPRGLSRPPPAPTPTTTDQGTPAPPKRSPGRASDAKAIDEDLERAFGSGRPTIPGPAAASAVPLPSWAKEVAMSEATDAGSGPRRLGGRYGDHLRVQLRSALDSRLCGTGAVEAVLIRPYLVGGALVLPPRTLAFGQCSTRGDRFLLTFSRLRLPDGTEAQVEAVALDAIDGKPGVLASRRIGADCPENREGVGGEIARGAASTVLSAGASAAGLPGQLVNGAGQTAINTRPEQTAAAEDALLLDSKPLVDLFVEKAF